MTPTLSHRFAASTLSLLMALTPVSGWGQETFQMTGEKPTNMKVLGQNPQAAQQTVQHALAISRSLASQPAVQQLSLTTTAGAVTHNVVAAPAKTTAGTSLLTTGQVAAAGVYVAPTPSNSISPWLIGAMLLPSILGGNKDQTPADPNKWTYHYKDDNNKKWTVTFNKCSPPPAYKNDVWAVNCDKGPYYRKQLNGKEEIALDAQLEAKGRLGNSYKPAPGDVLHPIYDDNGNMTGIEELDKDGKLVKNWDIDPQTGQPILKNLITADGQQLQNVTGDALSALIKKENLDPTFMQSLGTNVYVDSTGNIWSVDASGKATQDVFLNQHVTIDGGPDVQQPQTLYKTPDGVIHAFQNTADGTRQDFAIKQVTDPSNNSIVNQVELADGQTYYVSRKELFINQKGLILDEKIGTDGKVIDSQTTAVTAAGTLVPVQISLSDGSKLPVDPASLNSADGPRYTDPSTGNVYDQSKNLIDGTKIQGGMAYTFHNGQQVGDPVPVANPLVVGTVDTKNGIWTTPDGTTHNLKVGPDGNLYANTGESFSKVTGQPLTGTFTATATDTQGRTVTVDQVYQNGKTVASGSTGVVPGQYMIRDANGNIVQTTENSPASGAPYRDAQGNVVVFTRQGVDNLMTGNWQDSAGQWHSIVVGENGQPIPGRSELPQINNGIVTADPVLTPQQQQQQQIQQQRQPTQTTKKRTKKR